jgi:F-type H+-transporting ATPase subunit delta
LRPQTTMNSLRIARAALRARPAALRAPLQRRGYAEAVSDKVRVPPVAPRSALRAAKQL